MTAFTAYLALATSATLSNSAQLYKVGGTPTNSGVKSLVGTATGYGILNARGSAGAWAAAGSLPAQAGKGFFLDDTSLEGQTFAAGSWSATVHLIADQSGSPGGTLTADIIVRVSKYNTSTTTYTTIVTMTLTGQTITSTAANYSLSGSTGSTTDIGTGEKLFIDIFCNVTVNGNANANQQINLQNLSTDTTTFTGSSSAAIVSPGYSLTTNATTVTESATGSEVVVASLLTLNSAALTERALGVTSVAIANPKLVNSASVTESAKQTEFVFSNSINLSIFSGQMQLDNLTTEYNRIMSSVTGPVLDILATTYYGNSTNNQVIYGELDALFPFESMSSLHSMKSANDVTTFLQSYEYLSNVLTDTPSGYWRLNEPLASTSALDVSGFGMNGTYNGGVTLGQPGMLAVSTDTSALFDGSTGYVVLPKAVNPANWSTITVEVWIKLTNNTFINYPCVLANDNPNAFNSGINLIIAPSTDGKAAWFIIGVGGTHAGVNFGSSVLSSGVKYHLACTYDGTMLRGYINGVLAGTQTISGAIIQAGSALNIGRNPSYNGDYLPATVGQVSITKQPLSAARIAAHYNAGVAP